MTTHHHVISDVDDEALPIGMHSLSFRYAVQFNKRHGMKGHVLELVTTQCGSKTTPIFSRPTAT